MQSVTIYISVQIYNPADFIDKATGPLDSVVITTNLDDLYHTAQAAKTLLANVLDRACGAYIEDFLPDDHPEPDKTPCPSCGGCGLSIDRFDDLDSSCKSPLGPDCPTCHGTGYIYREEQPHANVANPQTL